MKNKIFKAVEFEKESFLNDLKKLVSIDSSKGEKIEGAPFGIGPKNALLEAVEIAKKLGFKTRIVNDSVGYAQLGETDEYIGIIGHVDVVPAGGEWSSYPFTLTERNGKLYARGVLDNKGPILSCLYALKIIRDMGIMPRTSIRIMFGTDEESGSEDIKNYLQVEKPPIMGFTPDCKYPVVYGERGILDIELITKIESCEVIKVEGNFDKSHVPDMTKITLKNGKSIVAEGGRSPSNAPELGVNAITKIADLLLKEKGIDETTSEYFKWVKDAFHNKYYGEGVMIKFEDKESGKLILNPYNLVIEEDKIKLSVSIRYPVSVKEAEIIENIKENLFKDSEIKIIRSIPSTKFPLDHPLLKILKESYEEVTGEDGTPVTTTGSTYAKYMPNIVAFGPSFPGQKGIAHNKDEYIDIEDLFANMKIYAYSLYLLSMHQ